MSEQGFANPGSDFFEIVNLFTYCPHVDCSVSTGASDDGTIRTESNSVSIVRMLSVSTDLIPVVWIP